MLEETILRLLEDGAWHTIEELKTKLKVSEDILGEILGFLDKYGFLDFSEGRTQMKLSAVFLALPAH